MNRTQSINGLKVIGVDLNALSVPFQRLLMMVFSMVGTAQPAERTLILGVDPKAFFKPPDGLIIVSFCIVKHSQSVVRRLIFGVDLDRLLVPLHRFLPLFLQLVDLPKSVIGSSIVFVLLHQLEQGLQLSLPLLRHRQHVLSVDVGGTSLQGQFSPPAAFLRIVPFEPVDESQLLIGSVQGRSQVNDSPVQLLGLSEFTQIVLSVGEAQQQLVVVVIFGNAGRKPLFSLAVFSIDQVGETQEVVGRGSQTVFGPALAVPLDRVYFEEPDLFLLAAQPHSSVVVVRTVLDDVLCKIYHFFTIFMFELMVPSHPPKLLRQLLKGFLVLPNLTHRICFLQPLSLRQLLVSTTQLPHVAQQPSHLLRLLRLLSRFGERLHLLPIGPNILAQLVLQLPKMNEPGY